VAGLDGGEALKESGQGMAWQADGNLENSTFFPIGRKDGDMTRFIPQSLMIHFDEL
jgi:hypothetical protein